MMWWWGDGHMGAAGWIGLILMVVIWVLIVAGVVFLIRALVRGPRHPGYWGSSHYGPGGPGAAGPGPGGQWQAGPGMRTGNPDALRTLEERYARGEIDRDEFMQKKADLTGQWSGTTGQSTGQPTGRPTGQSGDQPADQPPGQP